MSDLVFSHDCLILDACCVLNLYASYQMESILTAIPVQKAVADYVKDHEALYIWAGPGEDVLKERESVNLDYFVDQDLIKIAALNEEDEANTFLHFASELDDGEAITGAIALHRNWAIATDDKKARALFSRDAPNNQIITTPELVKHWADSRNPSLGTIKTAIKNIQSRGRYFPDKQHPLYEWWQGAEHP
jgi:predicted nucleic acid-binding protein